MKTKPSKLEQALRNSPSDVFEVRASNGVKIEIRAGGVWVRLRTAERDEVCCMKDAAEGRRWALRQVFGRLSYVPHMVLMTPETLHAIAEVLETLNGEREWGEE